MRTRLSAFGIGIGLLFSAALNADQHPVYSEEEATLVLPSISLDSSPGHFQEAELELLQDNLWQLRDAREGKLNEDIQNVELITTDSFPLQAFLRISGEFMHGCARKGQVQSQIVNNKIIVNAYYENNLWTKSPEIVLCTLATESFTFVYPLPVYGLPAGDYTYELNNTFSGSFTLSQSNVYESSSPAWQ
ncbi:MAG: hypothetical protein Q7L19_15340 [Pseudohongiella sp.]|nr:hypothetical protein [Pseudohongiella sp.]